MAGVNFKSLQRLQYWQGQALRPDDFNTQLDSAEQLRWWHNRSAHGAFGVGFGLHVDPDFTVHCGLAYDCFGRELVVPVDRKDLKPADGEQYLELTYCGMQWIPPDRASRTSGVLLAHASGGVLDPKFRVVQARALSRPRLASGATPPGNTLWQKIKNSSGASIGLQVRIDTSAAGFTSVPLYFVSPVWSSPNAQFTPPYFSIADAAPDGFTARLLLQGIGEESFHIASAFPTVSQVDWTSQTAANLVSKDVVARLLPRVDKALHIDSLGAAGVLNLAGDPNTLELKLNGRVALLGFPNAVPVQPSPQAIHVVDATPFPLPATILRRERPAAGAAAIVDQVLPGKLVLPKTSVSTIPGDHLDVLIAGGDVFKVEPDGVTVTFTGPTALKANSIVIRTSTAIETEIPVGVDSLIAADGSKVKLKAAIPTLAKDDVLGLAAPGAKVTGSVETLVTAQPDRFAQGDMLRAAGGATAILAGRVGSTLLLSEPVNVAAGGESVSIGNVDAKSTLTETPADAHSVKVSNPNAFAVNDTVTLRDGTTPGAIAFAKVLTTGSLMTLDKPLTGAKKGDVVAAIRFGAFSLITAASPLTVADASVFRVGDLVAAIDGARIDCGEIAAIIPGVSPAGVLVLKTAVSSMTAGKTLGVLFPETVASINAVSVSSITIDAGPIAPQAGWFAGHIARWIDASAPVRLNAFPDGTLPGDSLGYAALTPSQPVLRFASDAKVGQFTFLTLSGSDEITRANQSVFVFVNSIDATRQAILDSLAVNFMLRPEEISAIGGFSAALADDFAAYAQAQGLSLCWLGCQMPASPPPDCPGIRDKGPCACQ